MRKRRERQRGKHFYIEDLTSHVSFTEKRVYLCTVGLYYCSLIEVWDVSDTITLLPSSSDSCNYNDTLTFNMWLNASLTSGVGRKMAWVLDWYANLKNTDICIFNGSTVPRGPRLAQCRGFTITLRHTTLGRTPLGEGSARRRELCLTTHDNHKRQTSMPLVGFEHAIQASERPQTCALDCAATGIGWHLY
jgi:hypothetical protein